MDNDGTEEPAGTSPGLNVKATEVWGRVIEDMEVTAEEYQESGWVTLELHPGDVTVASNADPPGLDVVLPNPEFMALEARVREGLEFTEYEVFRAEGTGIELALLVAKDLEAEAAVLVPLYYRVDDLASVIRARHPDPLPIYLRQLDEETIMLELTEPEILLPDEE